MAKPLGLNPGKISSKIKAVNFEAQSMASVAKNMAISLGNWRGHMDLMVVPLDDFDIILDIDFMCNAKVAVLPHLGGMLIMDEDNPSLVTVGKAIQKGKAIGKTELVLALQFSHSLKKGERTYLTAIFEVKLDNKMEIPDTIVKILKEFYDMMPPELLKTLSLRHAIDHKIGLE